MLFFSSCEREIHVSFYCSEGGSVDSTHVFVFHGHSVLLFSSTAFPFFREVYADSTNTYASLKLDTNCVYYFHEGDSISSNTYSFQIYPSQFRVTQDFHYYDVAFPTSQDTIKFILIFLIAY